MPDPLREALKRLVNAIEDDNIIEQAEAQDSYDGAPGELKAVRKALGLANAALAAPIGEPDEWCCPKCKAIGEKAMADSLSATKESPDGD